jgi:hypothetical protein
MLVTGVVDSGHCGPLGGVLMVGNTCGLRFFEGGGADDEGRGWRV